MIHFEAVADADASTTLQQEQQEQQNRQVCLPLILFACPAMTSRSHVTRTAVLQGSCTTYIKHAYQPLPTSPICEALIPHNPD